MNERATAPASAGAVHMSGIGRRFGRVQALDDVDFTLARGEIHALLGENGAGKSTLMRILAGLDTPDDGTVEILGETIAHFDPRDVRRRGVAMVQQHFTLVPTMTAGENLWLSRPGGALVPARSDAGRRVQELAERFGLSVPTDVPVAQMSVGEQQRLEIIRALDADVQVLLLDEPTAVLTDREAEDLLAVCRRLRDEGRSIVFITHRLGEVFGGADRVTVLRGGRSVLSGVPVEGQSRAGLASLMVGADALGALEHRRTDHRRDAVRLRLTGVDAGRLRGIDLAVRAGEIVGVAGVDGNGQAELEQVISAQLSTDAGVLEVDGAALEVDSPRRRIARRIGYIPSDRYRWGMVRPMSIADNLELGRSSFWRRRRTRRVAHAGERIDTWDVRCAGPTAEVRSLSGGNAQKLLLSRELDGETSVILACYPTRGLDPEAARVVVERIVERAEHGSAVVWIGAELDELFAVADRIVVLAGGRITGEFPPPFDRAAIGLAMTGVH
jgi:general nucleoside transport system ATP-binding protein